MTVIVIKVVVVKLMTVFDAKVVVVVKLMTVFDTKVVVK
jgi:hypothetical protein